MEMSEDYHYMPPYRAIYDLRKETIERVFGDAKEKHGMRYTQLRGLLKVKMQVALTFACMNLKKLANGGRRADRRHNIRLRRAMRGAGGAEPPAC